LTKPKTQALIFSPSEGQSKELLGYVREMNDAVGRPVKVIRQSMTELAWENGSVVKAKADAPKSARGFTPNILIIDEGAQVSDELYLAVKPMMVLGNAEMMILSTPYGQVGWFFEIWKDKTILNRWKTFEVNAYQCPRIDKATLEEHRLTMPPRWFDQEYMLAFNSAVDAVFPGDIIDRAARLDDAYLPLEL